MKGKVTGSLSDGRVIITIGCGCQYVGNGRSPLIPCDVHRYIVCGNCGGQAEVSPIGVLCVNCTFGSSSS